MCLLTEAIRVENKKLCNLEYHQARLDKARRELLGLSDKLILADEICIPDDISDATYKCKIIYSCYLDSVEFTLYNKRLPKSIRLVNKDDINYSFKYENREIFNALLNNSGSDEVLIVRNGMITDTSRSNVVLSRGNYFVTPSTFLLEGTMRKNMLARNLILEEEISAEKLFSFERIFLINAMLDLDNQPGLPVCEIRR
jgi:4-amino-4-deoxychorismate lyase